jgi:hypothetical protein
LPKDTREKRHLAKTAKSGNTDQLGVPGSFALDRIIERRRKLGDYQLAHRGGHDEWISYQNPKSEWQEPLNLDDTIKTAGEDMCWSFTINDPTIIRITSIQKSS